MPDELEVMLYESNFDPWESVSSILAHAGERAIRLKAHILETKLMYWQLICSTLNLEPPPTSLLELMHFECRVTALLSVEQLAVTLEYSGRELSVAALIRLSARHSVWHAGQIALTKF
jgi:hypothetical protein